MTPLRFESHNEIYLREISLDVDVGDMSLGTNHHGLDDSGDNYRYGGNDDSSPPSLARGGRPDDGDTHIYEDDEEDDEDGDSRRWEGKMGDERLVKMGVSPPGDHCVYVLSIL